MQNLKINSVISTDQEKYLSDKDIAEILSVSSSWVRKQRHLKRKGEDNLLPVEAVYIGSSPRYRALDIKKWLADL